MMDFITSIFLFTALIYIAVTLNGILKEVKKMNSKDD